MVHASLFSGIGGPEVAAAMMGWENAFHCEIDPFGRAVLEYWFPDSKSYEDITKTDFREWRGKIDILTGGFPCQPFSYAGKRGGADDNRYLWPQMLRAIDEIRPTWVVGENVAGLATMVEGGVLADLGYEATLFGEVDGVHRYGLRSTFTIERICRDLENLGYSVQPVLIPAAAVGAPHRRDRIFIIAHVADTDRRDDVRSAGADDGTSGEERLQEWDEVRVAGGPGELLSEIQGAAENPVSDGCGKREHGEQGHQRNERNAGSGDDEWVYREEGIDASDTMCGRSGEVPSSVHARVADGAEPFGNGRERFIANTNGEGREESEQPGRESHCPKEGARLDNRVKRSGGDGHIADSFRKRLSAAIQSRIHGEEERNDARRSAFISSYNAWAKGTWWDNFPTVSPVHRGNDGIPIRLDDLSLPESMRPKSYRNSDEARFNFGKWRTESLKAYGNAIVPQVMYRIFQAIEGANY